MKLDRLRNRFCVIPEADHILLNEVKAGRSFCFIGTMSRKRTPKIDKF